MSATVLISPRRAAWSFGFSARMTGPFLRYAGERPYVALMTSSSPVSFRSRTEQALTLHDLGHRPHDVVEHGVRVQRRGQQSARLRQERQFVDLLAQERLLVAHPRERVGEELEERDGRPHLGLRSRAAVRRPRPGAVPPVTPCRRAASSATSSRASGCSGRSPRTIVPRSRSSRWMRGGILDRPAWQTYLTGVSRSPRRRRRPRRRSSTGGRPRCRGAGRPGVRRTGWRSSAA